MTYVIGIDGGGSTVRVSVVTPDLLVVGEANGTTSNPNLVGRTLAMQTIQSTVREAVAAAHLTTDQIAAVGQVWKWEDHSFIKSLTTVRVLD